MASCVVAHSGIAVASVDGDTLVQGANPAHEQVLPLEWPLRAADGFADPGHAHITGFVDHAPGPDVIDYNCGSRSYDGHRGTDISLYPFPWHKVEHDHVEVVAAAPGVITEKIDGYDSASCGNGDPIGNTVRLVHTDGTESVYKHLKKGSLTSKGEGDTVMAGEYLAVVASSGNSTGPHLHFEYLDSAKEVLDPFYKPGGCNDTVGASRWKAPRDYLEPAINKLLVTEDEVELSPACGVPGEFTEGGVFCPGAHASFYLFYVDLMPGLPSAATIYDADGEEFHGWEESTETMQWLDEAPFHSAVYSHRSVQLPYDAKPGTWLFSVEFDGEVYDRAFEVGGDGCAASSCTDDADCGQGMVCDGGACVGVACDDDADCEGDEVCELESGECVLGQETGGVETTGEPEETSGSTGGDATGDDPSGETLDPETGGPPTYWGDGGCSCAADSRGGTGWLLALLVIPLARRRRAVA